MRHHRTILAATSLWFVLIATDLRGDEPGTSSLVRPGQDGKLVYRPYSDRGDTVLDFSHCGYKGGGVKIPAVPVVERLEPSEGTGDDRPRIQAAIDRVARRPVGGDGFRGAVLLGRGTYRIGGTIRIRDGGIVLRGEGDDPGGTVLTATGREPYTVLSIEGRSGPRPVGGTARKIADAYVPVGARRFAVSDGSKFRVGDAVLVIRHGNAAWIHEIGMDRIPPRPGDPASTRQWKPFDLAFDRVVAAVEGDHLTLDAPIACAIDERWGGGEVVKADDGRIHDVGVEDLRAISQFDPSRKARRGQVEYFADEDHATYLVEFENVRDAWARRVSAKHFVQGVSAIRGGAKRVTVEDGSATEPVSLLAGSRRYAFASNGQLSLVQRCFSRGARHAFVVGSRVAGPNVFLDCKSEEDYGNSEPHHRWSVGGLYDNVEAPLSIKDRKWMGTGHGWAGANYVAWNCSGKLTLHSPPTAINIAIGFVGQKAQDPDRPDGHWESYGRHVAPRSLYRAQLADRLGEKAVANIGD